MKKLTKRQRLSHYQKALKMIESNEQDFICCALSYINLEMDELYDSDLLKDENNEYTQYIINNYPEFYSFKPKNKDIGTAWWSWNSTRGHNARINTLNKCIELCKPKKNDKQTV